MLHTDRSRHPHQTFRRHSNNKDGSPLQGSDTQTAWRSRGFYDRGGQEAAVPKERWPPGKSWRNSATKRVKSALGLGEKKKNKHCWMMMEERRGERAGLRLLPHRGGRSRCELTQIEYFRVQDWSVGVSFCGSIKADPNAHRWPKG